MSKIYLYDHDYNAYLCVNLTRQTSTGWYSNLAKVEALAETTERSLRHRFKSLADVSLDDAVLIANAYNGSIRIHRIEDDVPTAYEYW